MDLIEQTDDQVKKANEMMRKIEIEAKNIFSIFAQFKEGQKLMDEYEKILAGLMDELPSIM